jgi:hypothetical protein
MALILSFVMRPGPESNLPYDHPGCISGEALHLVPLLEKPFTNDTLILAEGYLSAPNVAGILVDYFGFVLSGERVIFHSEEVAKTMGTSRNLIHPPSRGAPSARLSDRALHVDQLSGNLDIHFTTSCATRGN